MSAPDPWNRPEQPYPPQYSFPQPPEASGRGKGVRVSTVIAVIAGLVTVASLSVIGNTLLKGGETPGSSSTSSTTTSALARSTSASPLALADPSAPASDTPAPLSAQGWQQVAGKSGFTYEVPPDWHVNTPTTVVGWEKPCPNGPFGHCPIRTLQGVAERPHPDVSACEEKNSGFAGFPVTNDGQIPAAERQTIDTALEAEAERVPDIFTDWDGDKAPPTVSRSPVKTFQVGNAPAVAMTLTATNIKPGECGGASAVYLVAVTTNPAGRIESFAVTLDQGYPGAASPELAQQILDTLRPTGQ
jgi:hypothetical protein